MSLHAKVFICIGFLSAHSIYAQVLSANSISRGLEEIRITADAICEKTPIEKNGKTSSIEASAAGDAELNLLISKLAKIGVKLEVKTALSEYKNVLQKDLPQLLSQTQECKTNVFNKLVDILFASVQYPPIDSGKSQTVGNLVFTLNNVVRSGPDIVVSFTVRNTGQNDVRFTLFGKGVNTLYGGSRLFAENREFLAQSVNISGQEDNNLIHYKFPSDVPLACVIRFNNIPSNIKNIDLMKIGYSYNNMRTQGYFTDRTFKVN